MGVSWWVLGGSWGPRPNKAMRYQFFGAILGEKPVLGGALGAVLGSSWKRLGGLLGRLAVQDGTRIGKKIDPKID